MPNQLHGPPEAGDAEVIQSSLAEPERFEVIFHRYAPVVHGYLGRRAGPAADDLLSEVFLIAFRKRGSFNMDAPSARGWLFGIASNLLARRSRAETARYRALARFAAAPWVQADQIERSDARLDSEMSRRAIASGLAGLHPRDRDVLLMIAWGQMSYAEVAECLGIPVGTVRSRLNRARTRMRAHLLSALPPDELSPPASLTRMVSFAKDAS